jgi:aminomethyltransferase
MAADAQLRRTPLYDEHLKRSARMVEYAGWSMPVLYTSILEEARAVRAGVGIFDISHMGRVRVGGPQSTELLQRLTTNDVARLAPSEAHYSLLANANGGIIDDIIVYREAEDAYLVVINASNSAKDLDWIRGHAAGGVTIIDETADTAMIAVQGPAAPALVADLVSDAALLDLKRFQFATSRIAGAECLACRTGYTGEDGFELIVPARAALRRRRAVRPWRA